MVKGVIPKVKIENFQSSSVKSIYYLHIQIFHEESFIGNTNYFTGKVDIFANFAKLLTFRGDSRKQNRILQPVSCEIAQPRDLPIAELNFCALLSSFHISLRIFAGIVRYIYHRLIFGKYRLIASALFDSAIASGGGGCTTP